MTSFEEAYDFMSTMKANGWNGLDIISRYLSDKNHTQGYTKSEDGTLCVFHFKEGAIVVDHYGSISRFSAFTESEA